MPTSSRQKFMRSLSTAVVPKQFRRMNSVAFMLDQQAEETEALPDEFDHLKIRDLRQFALGIAAVFAISVCNAMLNNVVKNTAVPSRNYFAPSFTLWVRAGYRMLTFPAFIIFRCIYNMVAKAKLFGMSEIPIRTVIRDSIKIYGERKIAFERFTGDIIMLSTVTTVSQYCSFAPLYFSVSSGCLAAMGSSSIVYVFFVSVVVLKIDVIRTKIFGVCFFLIGIGFLVATEVLFNVKWYFSSASLLGGLLTAVYQVLFKVRIGGSPSLGRISFSTSLFATVTFVVMWPLVLTLRLTGLEQWPLINLDHFTWDLPWEMLMRTSTTAWALVFLINLGVAWTNPMFTSFGFLMTVPFTYVFDQLWNYSAVSAQEIAGAALVGVGFVLLVFGDVITWSHLQKEWKTIQGNTGLLWKKARQSMRDKAPISETPQTELSVFNHTSNSRRDSEIPVSEWSKQGNFRKVSAV